MNNPDDVNYQVHHSKLWLKTVYIFKAHIFNPLWKDRDSRRKTRYEATYGFVMGYLQRYAENVRHIVVKKEYGVEEPERAFSIWFQGEEQAPPLVKACFRNMRRHLSQELVVLDENTIFDWISLPDYIVRKWKEGKIPHAHFSDICRVELLYRHGGVWLDATDYVTAPIPKYIMDEDFFMYVTSGVEIRGSYSGVQNCFIHSKKGNQLLGIWREAIHLYWKNENRKINYFVHHLLLKLAVQNNEVASNLFDKMPKVLQDPTHVVWNHYLEKFDQHSFDEMTKDAFFQKTSYKSKSISNLPEDSLGAHMIQS